MYFFIVTGHFIDAHVFRPVEGRSFPFPFEHSLLTDRKRPLTPEDVKFGVYGV